MSVLQNYLVNNLPADNTSPFLKVFMRAVKLIINHGAFAAKALHKNIFLQTIYQLYRSDLGIK